MTLIELPISLVNVQDSAALYFLNGQSFPGTADSKKLFTLNARNSPNLQLGAVIGEDNNLAALLSGRVDHYSPIGRPSVFVSDLSLVALDGNKLNGQSNLVLSHLVQEGINRANARGVDYALRLMQPDDLEEVSTLYRRSNPYNKQERIKEWTRQSLTQFPNYHLVMQKSDSPLALDVAGSISGTIHQYKSNKIGFIEDLVVAESGMGIGSILINALAEKFIEVGLRGMGLIVYEENEKAIKFYRRLHFEERTYCPTLEVEDVPKGYKVKFMYFSFVSPP